MLIGVCRTLQNRKRVAVRYIRYLIKVSAACQNVISCHDNTDSRQGITTILKRRGLILYEDALT